MTDCGSTQQSQLHQPSRSRQSERRSVKTWLTCSVGLCVAGNASDRRVAGAARRHESGGVAVSPGRRAAQLGGVPAARARRRRRRRRRAPARRRAGPRHQVRRVRHSVATANLVQGHSRLNAAVSNVSIQHTQGPHQRLKQCLGQL